MDDLGPAELAEAVVELAAEFDAHVKQIIGDDLLTQTYPTIYAVGRASVHQPRLIDLHWGNSIILRSLWSVKVCVLILAVWTLNPLMACF